MARPAKLFWWQIKFFIRKMSETGQKRYSTIKLVKMSWKVDLIWNTCKIVCFEWNLRFGLEAQIYYHVYLIAKNTGYIIFPSIGFSIHVYLSSSKSKIAFIRTLENTSNVSLKQFFYLSQKRSLKFNFCCKSKMDFNELLILLNTEYNVHNLCSKTV